MRALEKLEPPAVLVSNQAAWTARYREAIETKAPLPSVWSHADIREALKRETAGRCAYCDVSIRHVAYENIEHYRPRKLRPDLVVDWANLTIACPRCNGSKLDRFDEANPYVYPFFDEPANHFVYAGDLVYAPGSPRGYLTMQHLGLNRYGRTKARRKRLDAVDGYLSRWLSATGAAKAEYGAFIVEDMKDGDYYQTVRAFLVAARFEHPDF